MKTILFIMGILFAFCSCNMKNEKKEPVKETANENYEIVKPSELAFLLKDFYYEGVIEEGGGTIPTKGGIGEFLCEGHPLELEKNEFEDGFILTKNYGKIKVRLSSSLMTKDEYWTFWLTPSQKEALKKIKTSENDKSGLLTSESQAYEYASTYKSSGLTMHSLRGWTFMSPSEARRKSNGNFEISSNTIFFVVNDIDVDANINVQYVGNFSSEAPNKEAAYRILQQLKSQVESTMRQQFQEFKIIKSQLVDFAGGAALEIVYQLKRGETLLQQRQLTLISNKKAYTLTCNAKKDIFDEYNLKAFEIMLNSIKID